MASLVLWRIQFHDKKLLVIPLTINIQFTNLLQQTSLENLFLKKSTAHVNNAALFLTELYYLSVSVVQAESHVLINDLRVGCALCLGQTV